MPNVYEPLVLEIEPPYIGSAFSPTVDIDETADDITVTITDSRGEHSYTVDKTDDAIADAEAAAANANQAASDVQSAVDAASTAATRANESADAADDAASAALAAKVDTEAATTAANAAASAASSAASTANASAANADARAALANTAASNADAKAALANTAAANADAKAQLANNAAASATSAASDASTAAEDANDAADAANQAAQDATEAADDAREAISEIPKLTSTITASTPQTVSDALPKTPVSAELYGKSVQDGTPTPDAPVDVQVVRGRNIFNPAESAQASSPTTSRGLTVTYKGNGIFNISGTSTASTNGVITILGDSSSIVIAGEALTLSALGSFNTEVRFQAINANGDSFSITSDGGYVTLLGGIKRIAIYIHTSSNGKTYDFDFKIQVENGSTATPYVPYGCIGLQIGETTVPIDLQGNTLASLPDGTRDVLRVDSAGQVTIEKRTNSVKVSELNWSASSPPNHIFRAQFESTNTPIPYTHSNNTNYALSTGFIQKGYGPLTASDNGYFAIGLAAANNHRLIYVDHRYSTQSDFEQGAASILCIYRLLDQTTIDLGTITLPEMSQPCEIAIYASLDPTWAIEYERDPNVVVGRIEASIAPVEGATASTNYAIGGYFVHAGKLYKATSAIATGETINPGTNCVQTTVMAELVALTA